MSESDNGRHEEVFNFIKRYWSENGLSPAVRDVAVFLHSSTSVAQYYLDRLERSGHISRGRFQARSIRLSQQEYECQPHQ